MFVAYLPAVHGTGVWDDDYMFTANPVLAEPNAVWRIWTDLSAVPVYYPLTLTVLWAEVKLFGLANLTGYHVVHTLVHAANAVLVWRLLRRLNVPGAFAAGLLWGVHPVAVESVAWLTELKNTLSGLFYLLSIGALLRYYGVIGDASPARTGLSASADSGTPTTAPLSAEAGSPVTATRSGRWYALALLLFALSLAAKTTAVTMPAAALLVVWWKAGRLRPGQVVAAVPFLLVAAVAGAVTQHVETTYTGRWDERWGLPFAGQMLVAGRAVWFYTAKLAWPAGLSFVYPRWHVDPSRPWQWAFPTAVAAVVVGLWFARRRLSRGPLVGVLFFCGTLAPALGFFHVLYQRYSFVADHFQYLAGVGLIAVATAALWQLPHRARVAIVTVVALALMATTAQSSRRFVDNESAWSSALDVDPANPFANWNVAVALVDRQQFAAAEPHLAIAAREPLAAAGVWATRGRIAEWRGDNAAALACYGRSVALDPAQPQAQYQLGTALLVARRPADAVGPLRQSIRYRPTFAEAHDNLGVALLSLGQRSDALAEFREAQRLNPALPLVQRHLARATAEE